MWESEQRTVLGASYTHVTLFPRRESEQLSPKPDEELT